MSSNSAQPIVKPVVNLMVFQHVNTVNVNVIDPVDGMHFHGLGPGPNGGSNGGSDNGNNPPTGGSGGGPLNPPSSPNSCASNESQSPTLILGADDPAVAVGDEEGDDKNDTPDSKPKNEKDKKDKKDKKKNKDKKDKKDKKNDNVIKTTK